MANMKDFLTMYYNRLIFRNMQYEQFVQFCGYIKDKKATDNQKIWAEELLKKDPATGEFMTRPDTNIYIPKELPDPADPTEGLSDDEWEKLFRAFQQAFQSMDGAKKDFKYNDKAKKFFESYFGTNPDTGVQNMFQHPKIKPSAESKLYKAPTPPSTADVPGTLYYFLKRHENILKSRFAGGYYNILTDDFSYTDLLNGLKDGKYKTSASFRSKLEAVAGYVEGYKADLVQANIPAAEIPDLSDYDQWYDKRISPMRLDQFKREYKTLLNTLHKESKVREVFEQHDNGKISGPLNKAIKSQSYDDPQSEDYVQPKREDTLTMKERLAEWWSDTYSDCLEKYVKLKGDRLFFSDEAKNICKHLQKDLKKTDGLDGVLKNVGAAKDKLKAAREFKSVKHLEWFEKTMNALKNDPKLSKVWAGALKDGTHMQALIKEVIIRAIQEGKKDEAKTAMELISVFHYDYTTSKIMDVLRNENLSIFSDDKLSWNKNEGVQFVTRALDKSIKWAMMGIGYGITMAGNAYKLSGRKINKYSDKNGGGSFKATHDAYLEKQQEDRITLENTLADEHIQRTTVQGDVDGIKRGRTFDVAKANLESNIQRYTNDIDNFCRPDIDALNGALTQATNNFNASGTWDPLASEAEYDAVSKFLNSIQNDALEAKPTLTGTGAALQPHLDNIEANFTRLTRNRTALKLSKDKFDNLVNGQELLDQLNEQITRHENEVRNWNTDHTDEMEELVLHWNMLETGRNTKTGPMYNWFRNLNAKSAQKRLANQRDAIIAGYNSSHSIAA